MSKEHLMKHYVDLQVFHTVKQTGEADIDGRQMMNKLDVLIKKQMPHH
jgi:hypothetical protein